jgi:hypothetical protein
MTTGVGGAGVAFGPWYLRETFKTYTDDIVMNVAKSEGGMLLKDGDGKLSSSFAWTIGLETRS